MGQTKLFDFDPITYVCMEHFFDKSCKFTDWFEAGEKFEYNDDYSKSTELNQMYKRAL